MLLTALVAAAAFLLGLRAGIALGYRGERKRAALAAKVTRNEGRA